MNIGGCGQADQCDCDKHHSQRQGERAEIRPRSFDEETEDARGYRRQDEAKKCHDHPKHQNLQTVLNPAASGQDEIGRAEIGNLEALPLPH